MSIMGNRLFAMFAARAGGFFWLPCPSCGKHFGGHEWSGFGGHSSSIPTDVRRDPDTGRITSWSGRGICPDCTLTGVGCRAHGEVDIRPHRDCEFLPPVDPPEGS